jgi:hypothetical protein
MSRQMKQRRDQHLSESDILREVEQFAEVMRAYRKGKRGNELPRVLPFEAGARFWALGSCLLHPLLAVFTRVAQVTHTHRMAALLARARIASDRLSYEPRSCGLNNAYTNLGLALLRQNDVIGAIECLEASWHVHPCPHNTSFGLKTRLAAALKPHAQAHASLEQYERMRQRLIWR